MPTKQMNIILIFLRDRRRWKKGDHMDWGVDSNELQSLKDCLKALHNDVKSVRIIVKNIDSSLGSANENTNADEDDKCSDDVVPVVTSSDKLS